VKAIVGTEYGSPDALELQEIDTPVLEDDRVLVRVRAASVNPYDWHLMRGLPYLVRVAGGGLRRPKVPVLGVDVAGQVEAVGADVTEFKPGDEVFGSGAGTFAEYTRGRERNFVPKPAGITFEQASAVAAAGCTALQALRDRGRIQAGQRVLVNGAAGGVGTFAVQLAKEFGAEVTGVCSTRNVDMVRSIGADRVVDYTSDDFTRSGERYDLIVDNVGNRSLSDLRRVMTPKGTLVIVGGGAEGRWLGPLLLPLRAMALSRFVGQRLLPLLAKVTKADLLFLGDLLAAGKLTPVIDRTYSLAETPEALRYLEAGHAQGKVVITI
jgi:NADPH:quinone reductase-like Zn-dependent oxidoreductase